MCGRFSLATGSDVLKGLFNIRVKVPVLEPSWNVAPSRPVAVVVITDEAPRSLRTMRWGLIPKWAKDASIGSRMINARAESVAETPAFSEALRQRRCIVVADGFYEWVQKGPEKYAVWVHPKAGGVLALAGLWDQWTDKATGEVVDSCTIITTAANATMAPFHHRMPVILSQATWDIWLDPAPASPVAMQALLGPAPDTILAVRTVSNRVNSVANDGPDLVEPAE